MKVSALIEALKAMPQDADVVIAHEWCDEWRNKATAVTEVPVRALNANTFETGIDEPTKSVVEIS
ncbi:hypothetical protein QDY63_11005 [Pseudomonas brenneri]|uniref:hypothetical protein n=1 Tax=Pseudomonas TaxID=286 RepID=UPI0025A2D8D9|nr:hypothetical protein [Pseudomonas brenneri]WJM93374.1 hypothetical protein QDY63_11005 [Pseudomonas brenneri]